jgi:hypothetical protein
MKKLVFVAVIVLVSLFIIFFNDIKKIPFIVTTNSWKVDYTIDEFGNKTSDKVFECMVKGNMSNNISMNNKIFVRLLYTPDKDILQIDFFKNRRGTKSAVIFSSKFYDGSTKDINGEVLNDGYIQQHNCLYQKGQEDYNLLKFLKRSSKLSKSYLQVSILDEHGSRYINFDVPTAGFSALIENSPFAQINLWKNETNSLGKTYQSVILNGTLNNFWFNDAKEEFEYGNPKDIYVKISYCEGIASASFYADVELKEKSLINPKKEFSGNFWAISEGFSSDKNYCEINGGSVEECEVLSRFLNFKEIDTFDVNIDLSTSIGDTSYQYAFKIPTSDFHNLVSVN